MAPRASWKGYLKLSLVSCPVRLYPATSTNERVRFNQLHKDTHNRINMKPVDPELGLVERSDLVKGYEYEDKKYIIIDDSDLEAVRIESNHTLNIEAFVDAAEVDVIYQDTPYYLAPDGKMAEETFVVLREAMRAANKLAIARLVLSSRERVVTIGARDKGMFVSTLRAPNEVRATSTYFDEIPDIEPDAEMLGLAEALIAQKTTAFDPKAYEDRYETALLGDDQGEAQGPQADHRRGARARQRRQPDGRAEAEPVAVEAPGAEPQQGPHARAGGEARQGDRHRRPPGPQGEIVTPLAGASVGTLGALAALPRRLAAREVKAQGGELHRGVDPPHDDPRRRPDPAHPARRPRDRRPGRGGPRAGADAPERERLPAAPRRRRPVRGADPRRAPRSVRPRRRPTSTSSRSSTPSSTTPSRSRSAT